MDISDGGLFANDVEMSAEMSDIPSPGNGGLFANDVVMSAETSDIPLPRETEADGGSNEDQLGELLRLSLREAEAYIHLPPKKSGGFWQTGEVKKLQVVAPCLAAEPKSGKIVDMVTGLWIYCSQCIRKVPTKPFCATQFIAHRCCKADRGFKQEGAGNKLPPPLFNYGIRPLKRSASDASTASLKSARSVASSVSGSIGSEASIKRSRSVTSSGSDSIGSEASVKRARSVASSACGSIGSESHASATDASAGPLVQAPPLRLAWLRDGVSPCKG